MADAIEKLLSRVRAAVDKYNMINKNDKIAVGLSGGKDSVALLILLKRLSRFYPSPFDLTAVTIDPCFDGAKTDFSSITELCSKLEVEHIIKRTRLSSIVFEERKETNPCSLCARMRRGALHKAAQEAGCNVVALGHHKDDAAETLLMNMFSGGTIGCFSPVSELTRRNIRLIRPLIFIEEKEIASAAVKYNVPVVKSSCPADGNTHRQQMRNLIAQLSKVYGPLPERLIGAMQKANISRW